jgi:hypothetical protein
MKSRGRQKSQTSTVFLPISLSIETYALLIYIWSSRQFQDQNSRVFYLSWEVRTLFLAILKLSKNWNCNLCSSEMEEDFFCLSFNFRPFWNISNLRNNFQKDYKERKFSLIVSLLYHVTLWFCPAKLWKKSGHPSIIYLKILYQHIAMVVRSPL